MDTIFALASARGQAGIAVIRVSGPTARKACEELAGAWPEPGRATLSKLEWRGETIDQALVLSFEGPKSFTGEDIVEFHTHGSKAVVSAVLNALGDMPGLGLAEAGEFTRRALENGRLSLDEVEGLGDLITAETEGQRRQAIRAFSGRLRERVEDWRAALLKATALAEVTIDFADEEVPVDTTPEVVRAIEDARESLSGELRGFAAAEKVRDGFEVAIVGAPNVGKSSLLNALAGRDAAITSEIAGTTRDIVEVQMDLKGLPVTFLDTAGLRETEDQIESIGIARARTRAEAADLRVILLESYDQSPPIAPADGDIVLVTKSDLRDGDISSTTGEGLQELLAQIGSRFDEVASHAGAVTRLRHKLAIDGALDHLGRAKEIFLASGPTELGAEELRQAIAQLDSLVGRIDIEHVLGEIFSSFCIGK